MRRKTVKPISFRVYPEGCYLYCEVNIWPTRKDMRNHTRLPKDTVASCGGRESFVVQPKRKGKRQQMRKTGLFAEANFYKDEIGIEVVSHELTHAAFAFADRRRLPLAETVDRPFVPNGRFNTLDTDGPEERFCYAQGQMVRQFVNKCYEVGLYQSQ